MNNKLTEADRDSIKRMIESMGVDEMKEVLKAIPGDLMFDELVKRYKDTVEILNNISSQFQIGKVNFK